MHGIGEHQPVDPFFAGGNELCTVQDRIREVLNDTGMFRAWPLIWQKARIRVGIMPMVHCQRSSWSRTDISNPYNSITKCVHRISSTPEACCRTIISAVLEKQRRPWPS